MRKLPVLAIAGRTYAFLRDDAVTILRLSWLPLLIAAIFQYAVTLGMVEAFNASGGSANMGQAMEAATGAFALKGLLALLTALFTTAIVAVALHRVILFGERHPGTFIYFAFGKTEFIFVLILVLVTLVFLLLTAVTVPVMVLLWNSNTYAVIAAAVAGTLAAIYLLTRISLAFPIAVIRKRILFAESWALAKDNVWRLFAAWLLVNVPPTLLLILLNETVLPDTAIEPAEQVAWTVLVQSISDFFFSIVFGAVGVAFLSYSYKELTGHAPDDILAPEVE